MGRCLRALALLSVLVSTFVTGASGQQSDADLRGLGEMFGWASGCRCLEYNIATLEKHMASLFPQYSEQQIKTILQWAHWGRKESDLVDTSSQGCFQACEAAGRAQFFDRVNAAIAGFADSGRDVLARANSLFDEARYAEAEPLYKSYLAEHVRRGDADTGLVALAFNNLALLYSTQGRYDEAEPLFERGLAIRRKLFGAAHPEVAQSLAGLASLYDGQGRYGEAEPFYREALSIREASLGAEHPDVAASLGQLAGLLVSQGRYGAADALYRRALGIQERNLGTDHPDVAGTLNSIAGLRVSQGLYDDAEALHLRALRIRETAFGVDHPVIGQSVSNLALLYDIQGRYGAAEPLHRRALAIWETAFGIDHPNVAATMNNLAVAFAIQGRYAEAAPLYERALAIREVALGADHPDVAGGLNNLAWVYAREGRYDDAVALHRRALAIREAALGSAHPDVAGSLKNLASLYVRQRSDVDVEPMLRRALAIRQAAFGADHPLVAESLSQLAGYLATDGDRAEAERLFGQAIAASEKALCADHPTVATQLDGLAGLYQAQGRIAEALGLARRATAVFRDRAARASGDLSSGQLREQASVRHIFLRHVDLATAGAAPTATALNEGFEAGQLAQATDAAQAVARMGARFAAGDDGLAKAVRARQDAVECWRRLDTQLIEAVSSSPEARDRAVEERLRAETARLEARIAELDKRLAREFPEFAELASSKPLTVSDVQRLLAPTEALMTYLVGERFSYLWVMRGDRVAFHRIDVARQEIEDAVTVLRSGLDQSGIRTVGDIRPFDVEEAFLLYAQIFAPAEAALDGASHVFVVPDSALRALPLGVLVTAEPKRRIRKLSAYRDVPWLAKSFAFTTLPSVSSLRALRLFAKATRATRPFAGFGDPLLDGDPGGGRGVDVAILFQRGAVADVESVRQLPRLPETADELNAIARSMGADTDAVYLRERATEALARSEYLSRFRILAFATHGLIAGDIKGVAEPALVMTPPEVGSEQNDGLLTASEIATLDLDADWVILSACNTAAADGTPGGEGLSGLAKAFFFAGARALLVSHWSVASDATVKLTTGMLGALAKDPAIGRAESLRRAMLALMADEERLYFAHPMFWAPFVVVGEGAAAAAG